MKVKKQNGISTVCRWYCNEVINHLKDMQAQLEKEQKEDEEVYEKVWRPACFLPDDDNLGICRCVLRRSCDEVRISQNLWPFFVVPFPAIGYARVGIFN